MWPEPACSSIQLGWQQAANAGCFLGQLGQMGTILNMHRYPSVAAEMAKREGRAAGRLGTLELGIEQLELRFPVFWEHK